MFANQRLTCIQCVLRAIFAHSDFPTPDPLVRRRVTRPPLICFLGLCRASINIHVCNLIFHMCLLCMFKFALADGYGLPRDRVNAFRYFQLASHGGKYLWFQCIISMMGHCIGHLKAIYNLGEMNAEGIGIKRNCNYAVEVPFFFSNTTCIDLPVHSWNLPNPNVITVNDSNRCVLGLSVNV